MEIGCCRCPGRAFAFARITKNQPGGATGSVTVCEQHGDIMTRNALHLGWSITFEPLPDPATEVRRVPALEMRQRIEPAAL